MKPGASGGLAPAMPSPFLPFLQRAALRVLRRLPGSSNFKYRVYDRLIKAVRGRRILGRTYFGAVLRCDLDDFVGNYIGHFGFWEPHISAFIGRRLGPGDVFCDVGANIGYYSLLAAFAVGPEGRVVAIEPSAPIYDALLDNLKLNGVRNVRTVKAAVAAQAGVATLYAGPDWNTSMTTTVAGRGFKIVGEVPAATLEDILEPRERARLRLIKIDIEGAETPILERLLDRIGDYPAEMEIIVELSNADGTRPLSAQNAVIGRFLQAGYRAYELPNTYSPRDYIKFAGASAPRPLDLPLTAQKDVLFSKRDDVRSA